MSISAISYEPDAAISERENKRRERNHRFFQIHAAGRNRFAAWLAASREVGYPWWSN